jgi:hypothetical protein
MSANTLSGSSTLNFISTNNPTTASWSNYGYKIVSVADPNVA